MGSVLRWTVAGLTCVIGATLGCNNDPFSCSDHASCVEGTVAGTCEPSGYCSFPDPGCASGRRYGQHARKDLAGTCVPDDGADATGTGGATDNQTSAPDTTGSETSASTTSTPTSESTATDTTDPSTSSTGEPSIWFDPAWPFRKRITISAEDVAGSLEDFPVLVSVVDENLLDVSTGNDILFTMPDHQMILPHEIQTFDPGTGGLIAWVKLPELSGETDSEFFMYYGNGEASDLEDAGSVWSAYGVVLHMENMVEGHTLDSTTHGNDGAVDGATLSGGSIGNAFEFPGTGSNRITVSRDESWLPSTRVFFSCWFRAPSLALDNSEILVARGSGGTNEDFGLAWEWGEAQTRMRINQQSFWSAQPNLSTNTWHLVHGVYDAAANPRLTLYEDGAVVATSNDVSGPIQDGNTPLGIGVNLNSPGAEGVDSRRFEGQIDEVRLSIDFTPSAAWIATEYANQSDPASFVSVGPEEAY